MKSKILRPLISRTLGSLGLLALLYGNAGAQSLVSKTVQNKKFLIEKATGQVCSGCPALDDTCLHVVQRHPGKGFMIEYHVGPDARPQIGLADYTTKEGDSLYATIPFAYNMFVNRYDQGIPYGYIYIYNQVQQGAADKLAETSPVNVGLASKFNKATRELTVNVEAYYTADARTTTNFINVALTEDSVISPQYDARIGSPYRIEKYSHNHIFRGNLTGMWGDPVTTTRSTNLVTRTYKYTVPAKFKEDNCHLIVYITEDKNPTGKQSKTGDISNAEQSTLNSGTVGISEAATAEHIQVYPNPSNGQIFVSRLESGSYGVTVTDQVGNTVYQESGINDTRKMLDLSAHAGGLYFVKISTANGISTHKVLVSE